MVVMCASATDPTGTTQLRVALPFTCTVQAPQAATPHPNFVPVRFSSSRITQRSGASGSTSRSWTTPFTIKRIPTTHPRLQDGTSDRWAGMRLARVHRVCHEPLRDSSLGFGQVDLLFARQRPKIGRYRLEEVCHERSCDCFLRKNPG